MKQKSTLTWALASLCAAWLVGVVCAVHVSTWQAPEALMVFGADHLWRGATAGFRAVVRDSASHVPSARIKLVVWLESEQQRADPITIDTQDAAAWTMPVPAFAGERAWIALQRQPDAAPPLPTIKIPLHLVDHPMTKPVVLAPLGHHAPTVTTHASGMEVAWVPAGGLFAVGLQNPGIGQVLRNGRPWRRGRVRSAALHLDTLTDDDGLFDLFYTPPLHPTPVRFVLGDDATPMWVDLLPKAQVTQFQMLVPTRCFAQVDPAPLHIDTLPWRGALAVDLWLDDLLLGTTALPVQMRHSDATLSLKAALPAGFLAVVAFRHVLLPGVPMAALRPVGTSAKYPLAALAARGTADPWLQAMARRALPPSERLAAFVLSRVQPDHLGTPLLYDETSAVFDAFERHRDNSHRRIYQVMGGLMALSLGIIAVALWQMRRHLRRDVHAALHDTAEGGLADPDAARQMTHLTDRIYLVLAVLALALAGVGLITVVTRLRWG